MSETLGALSETLDVPIEPRGRSTDAEAKATMADMPEPSQRHLRLVVSTPTASCVPNDAVERAQQLMRADLATPWTVTSLARRVGVSRPVFARRFQSRTGTSPMRWLNERRMERAADRLRQGVAGSEEKLAVIAIEVGYRSEFAFNRAFKRHHGVAPGRYRQGTQTAFRAAA